jgi:hypothetical protein
MAGLRVTAIPYLAGTHKTFPNPDPAYFGPGASSYMTIVVPSWCFCVLVTDADGTPKTGLKVDNFSVHVQADGNLGTGSASSGSATSVSLSSASAEQSVPGVYTLWVSDGELFPKSGEPPMGAPKELAIPSPIPYVFSVSVTIYGSRSQRISLPWGTGAVPVLEASGCALVSFLPAAWNTPNYSISGTLLGGWSSQE